MYNRLLTLIRSKYAQYNYSEIISPLLFSHALWKQSGHWEHYSDDMFVVTDAKTLLDPSKLQKLQSILRKDKVDHETMESEVDSESMEVNCLKPMNCPGHCLVFGSSIRSYRELPLRFADFSPLHRFLICFVVLSRSNESSGALTGLTRVRRFEQDDAHIFCMPSQIEQEIRNCLDFVYSVYSKLFGMNFMIKLSTRPVGFLGSVEEWDHAELALRQSLANFEALMKQRNQNFCWEVNSGDGAFYGPKLDVVVTDALGRHHQCATVQLDFQLPRRFHLKYTDKDSSFQTPVMIHRAILGSFQRIIAILTEHTGGRWPFWINPRQIMVCPITEKNLAHATAVYQKLQKAGYFVDLSDAGSSLKRRIRDAQVEQYNFILVLGDKETNDDTITVRTRDGEVRTTTLELFLTEISSLSLANIADV